MPRCRARSGDGPHTAVFVARLDPYRRIAAALVKRRVSGGIDIDDAQDQW